MPKVRATLATSAAQPPLAAGVVVLHRTGRVVAAPGAPSPRRELPDVDGQVLLLVQAELVREPRAAASAIAARLGLETRSVRKALEVLAAYEDLAQRRG